jgi:hypothetical protein
MNVIHPISLDTITTIWVKFIHFESFFLNFSFYQPIIFIMVVDESHSFTGIGLRPVVIPTYKEIDGDIIQSNIRTSGMSREMYFKYLEECK